MPHEEMKLLIKCNAALQLSLERIDKLREVLQEESNNWCMHDSYRELSDTRDSYRELSDTRGWCSDCHSKVSRDENPLRDALVADDALANREIK
jgi:hypothetical protein